MSGLIQEYKKELEEILISVERRIEDINKYENKDNREKELIINQIYRELEESDEILEQLKINKINKKELEGYIKEIKTHKRKLKEKEKQLLLGNNNNNSNPSKDFRLKIEDHEEEQDNQQQIQRNELLEGTSRLEESNVRLESIRRIALETEQIGISTLEDLNRQREQMASTRERLDRVDGWVNRSTHLLRTMHRRLVANRLLGYVIIVLLAVLILSILYVKLLR